MAIEDYIPNVFGSVPSVYQGLLGAEDTAALQKRANLAGLLSAGAALAQGMSPQGYRRSALQNILSAAAAGFGGAGQSYQSGIEQIAAAQKLGQSQQQIQAINNVLQDPNIDPAIKAYVRANPADGLKMLAETQMFQSQREKFKPQATSQVPAPQLQVEGMPATEVTMNPEISMLETQINNFLADASAYGAMRDPAKAEASIRSAEKLRERQQQLMASDIDIDQRIAAAPEQYKEQYRVLKSVKGSLKPKELIDAVQKVDQAILESGKQYRYEGNTGQFAYRMFGTNDATKLTPEQNDLVLKFANAPTQADQTKIVIDAERLRQETGRGVPLPTSREQMIAGQIPASTQVAAQVTQQVPQAAQQIAPQVVQPEMPYPAPQPKPQKVVDISTTPLIQQPDVKVPPKTKQKLIESQPATESLARYTLKNVVDSRDSAQKLLDNPAYIKALTGMTAPAMARIPGTDAYTANELLKNLLGRSFVTEIQQMRMASPTGGAVGNVAVAEMESLSKIQSALSIGMSEKEFRDQLKQYINVTKRAIKTIPNEYARTYGYNGEFDEVLTGTVVPPSSASQLPQGVTVKKVR